MIRWPFSLMLVAFAHLGAALAEADLEAVRAEKKLEKRARLALQNADRMITTARDAYQNGDAELLRTALEEVAASVELCYQSLRETGKDPRRNFRHYKHAEITTRQLLRRLSGLRDEMSYLDRELIDPVIERVEHINKELLHDIMGGRK
jgi:phage shock protein A